MSYTIENNVAPPALRQKFSYPFDQLEVGQSFVVVPETVEEVNESKVLLQRVRGACSYAQRSRPGKRFTSRLLDKYQPAPGKKSIHAVRVWRLEDDPSKYVVEEAADNEEQVADLEGLGE